MPTYTAYLGTNFGTLMCVPYNVGANTRINSFSMRLGQIYNGHEYYGIQIDTGVRRTVRGAIWNNRPSSPNQSPDYLSTNEINVSNCYQMPMNSGSHISNLTYCTFYFNGPVVPSNNIYVGIYTPYPSDTALCYGTTESTLIYNEGGYMATWGNHGIYIENLSSAPPTVPPNAPRNIAISQKLIENQSYTVTWDAPTQTTNNAPTGYKVYLNDSLKSIQSGRSFTTSDNAGTPRGGTFTISVRSYNNAGESGLQSVSARKNQAPSAPSSFTINNNNSIASVTDSIRLVIGGSNAPTADELPPYNDRIASYEVQYRKREINGPWSMWQSLKDANGNLRYSFAGSYIDTMISVPDDVNNGEQIQFSALAIDSLGVRSPLVTSPLIIQFLWDNIYVKVNGQWVKANAYVKSNSQFLLATPNIKINGKWTNARR